MFISCQEDSYIQYTSSGPREGDLLQRLEAQQRNDAAPLTMRCLDSFATKDDAGKAGWGGCLEDHPRTVFNGE